MSPFTFKIADPKLQHLTITIDVAIAPHDTFQARLMRVIDGDTIEVLHSDLSLIESVRLLGIDTPETGSDDHARQQCRYLGVDMSTLHILARLSTLHIQWLCPKGSELTLKTTVTPRDGNKRILAGLFIREVCINRLMVEHGYAMAYRGYSDWEDLHELELQAKEAKRGIWGSCEEQYYLASSKAYHRSGCSSARSSAARFQTIKEAKAFGLIPCSSCIPDYTRP